MSDETDLAVDEKRVEGGPGSESLDEGTGSGGPRRAGLRARAVAGVMDAVVVLIGGFGLARADTSRVGGHPRLDARRPRRRLEPQPHHLRRERHHAVLGPRTRRGAQRPDGAGDVASPSGFVLPRRTVTSTPSPAGRLGDVAPRGRVLTSLRRIPTMKSSPAITASSWPRFRATSSDSTPRLRPAKPDHCP